MKSATSSHLPNFEPLCQGEASNTKPPFTLISVLSWCKSLLSMIVWPMNAPNGKNLKFMILQAKPTTIKLLRQGLWQSSVYANTNKNTVSAFSHHTYYDKSEKPLQVIFTNTLTINMN